MINRSAFFGGVVLLGTGLLFPSLTFAQSPPAVACTEIGCQNGVTLTIPPDRIWESGRYAFLFQIDQKAIKCWGKLPLPKCEEGPALTCDTAGIVTITESGCALPRTAHRFSDIYIAAKAKSIALRIDLGNTTIFSKNYRPIYKTLQPNGPQCGPVCYSASLPLF
jgi:hypothetical protein